MQLQDVQLEAICGITYHLSTNMLIICERQTPVFQKIVIKINGHHKLETVAERGNILTQ